ncbi:TPM domain-containing protein [Roseateles violae]|uniref:TPM domain-containing protein n=1 Tax=Roseateles violae TaxID=3058042 RepID=A0ABT8DRF2_9BURK|nr:TPM domain-containing protein [Pelomonas sp. PFR6]MDN3919620.1 TPM domain-containing protein [Pelomonas sp. PFR6]
MRAWLLLLSLLSALLGLPARAQDVLPVPALSARVIDQTGTLDARERAALETKLALFESQAGPQMVVLMVDSTLPEDNASYAQRVADTWKIGRREVGDGLLIVVAKSDRKVRIEVAKALEGAVPDLAARQIIQNAISPAFKRGDYAGGLSLAVDQLQARIRGEGLPAPTRQGPRAPQQQGLDFESLGALFFIGVPVLGAVLTGLFGRKLGSVVTGGAAGAAGWFIGGSLIMAGLAAFAALVLVGVLGIGAARRRGGLGGGGLGIPPVIWGGGGFGGHGGGGFGGGGFSSGGGGDFGGGGASGDW